MIVDRGEVKSKRRKDFRRSIGREGLLGKEGRKKNEMR
jgi:hypothetical protein